jgi:inosine/xanthosine triphosphatase
MRKSKRSGTLELSVVVGSTNPVKIGAVETVLRRAVAENLLPGVTSVNVRGVNVPSGISDQPYGDDETRLGATTRAKNVLDTVPDADWGVGVEGGAVKLADGYYSNAWIVIADRNGKISTGGGLYMPLPAPIVRDMEAGIELGHATDRLFGAVNSKQAGGALGYLSKNLRTRQDAYESIFVYALTKFLHPELYELTIDD